MIISLKRFLLAPLLVALLTLAAFVPARAQLGRTPRTVTVTAATYTDNVLYDVYQIDASSNAVAFTLRAPSKARVVVLVKTDTSTNDVTITTAGTGATINGQTSFILRSQNDAVTLVANGKSGTSGSWRVAAANRRISLAAPDKTIATTGATEWDLIAPEAGILVSAVFSGTDALTTSDTNYITYTITNLGQAGAGSTAMLAATAANTTQATGGTAISAGTKRLLTLNGTAGNLVVASGDRLRVRATATGTLANTVTFSTLLLRFAGM
jgi:hypothetical protein